MNNRAVKTCFFAAIALGAAYLLAVWVMAAGGAVSEDEYDFSRFGELVVSAQGRVKPMDSVARDTLDVISGRETVRTEDGEKKPAIRWLLDAIARPSVGRNDPVFRINNPGVLNLLDKQPGEQKYFSHADLEPHLSAIERQAQRADGVPSEQRSRFQQSAIALANNLTRHQQLRALASPYVVAPTTPEQEWRPFNQVAAHQRAGMGEGQPPNQSVQAFNEILHAYHNDNPERFNTAVADYHDYLGGLLPDAMTSSKLEVLLLNRFSPFYRAMILCVGVFLVGCVSSLGWHRPLRAGALGLVLVTIALVTFGLAARIYIQGRPPVTNLYSSALFIGWGCLLLGLFMDLIYRNAVGLVAAAIGGFTTFVVAMNLESGDTMGMMQAVLDTNFWLATHVVAITFGYSTVFFAGALGIIFILLGFIATALPGEKRDALMRVNKQTIARMIYGIVCFALLFSFVGTVLGGIWADQSWGRFWGWDPKENGAALIVLLTALILHARWGGLIRERGLAVLAVCGNIVTSWSWFGTNLLGVGLHSYGFMDSGVFWLGLFVLSQMFFIGLGLWPLRVWEPAPRTAGRASKVEPKPAAGSRAAASG